MLLQARQRLEATEEVCATCDEVHALTECTARRSQDWYDRLEDDIKADYTKKYPGTKFRAKPNLLLLG